MSPLDKRSIGMTGAVVLAMALFVTANFAHATNGGEARSLEKGAVPDVTPQQKYQSAIREAGGGYKEWLRECAQFVGDAHKTCGREAKAVYDRDMAEARRILQSRNDAPKTY